MTAELEEVLLGVHQRLAMLLRAHQVAVIDRDLAVARARWNEFASLLDAHITDEEELLLPLFAERGGEQLQSPPRQFQAEHAKMRVLVDQLTTTLGAMEPPPSHDQVLELLERESRFRGLMMHHDLRERHVLYPWLSSCTSEAERRSLADKLLAR